MVEIVALATALVVLVSAVTTAVITARTRRQVLTSGELRRLAQKAAEQERRL